MNFLRLDDGLVLPQKQFADAALLSIICSV